MKSDNSAVVYNAESTAAGLNRVKGFDPLKYVRSTENGAVLDLPYQKLWFRLRHPNGKIRIFIKNLYIKIDYLLIISQMPLKPYVSRLFGISCFGRCS